MQLMKMKLLPLLFIFLGASICEIAVSEDNDAELERQTKFMVKAPIKTILVIVLQSIWESFDFYYHVLLHFVLLSFIQALFI